MLRFTYYSNYVALDFENDDDEVYRLDQIREFEHIDPAWKEALTEYLQQGQELIVNIPKVIVRLFVCLLCVCSE